MAYRSGMTVDRRRVLIARVLAVAADAVQLGLMPLFVEGGASLLSDALDVVMALTLSLLVGWHWAFLPSFAMKLVPFVDLAPTWTIAVLVATRGSRAAPAPALEPKR
jgi:hypothetical protein